jgi:hypothetical protein
MPLGVNHITPSSAANFIPQQWRSEVRIARKSKFVMKEVADQLPIQGQKGNQFHIPNLSNLVASTKVPGAPVNLLQPNEGEFVLTIDKHKEVSVLVEDITEVQETYFIRSRYTKQMGAGLANALDDDLMALRLAFTQTISASGVGLTEAKILTTKQTMDEADVPSEDRYLVIPPAGENDLLSINRFVAADIRQNVADMIGMGKFIGRIHGFSVMMTNRVKAGDSGRPGVGGGTAGTYYSLACHGEALMYGMPRDINVQSQYKLEYLGTLVVSDEIYGVGQYRNDHGVVIQSV